jgi:hypothetical protein
MNLTFLSKLGKAIATGLEIATGIGPIISPFIGAKAAAVTSTVINDGTLISQVIAQVESIFQTPGSGATKAAAALPFVESIVRSSEAISGHKIANEALFVQGCSKIVSGYADVLNSLSPDSVDTSGKPLPPPVVPQS